MTEPLLSVRGLTVDFPVTGGFFRALDNVSVDIGPEEHVAVIGESGCGKSVLGHSILRLLDGISETQGKIVFGDLSIRDLDDRGLRNLRGKEIALIPQSPSSSMDPVVRIGVQIDEMYVSHGHQRGKNKDRIIQSLGEIGFDDPKMVYGTYPHRMSGGMCERAVISMGLTLGPELLIADEPTKGLDPSSKMNVLRTLDQKSRGKAMMMITHDYNAARICERTIVMYSGRIVEDGPTSEVLDDPKHPYTRALWDSLPSKGMRPIPGSVMKAGSGCDFINRCPFREESCQEFDQMTEVGSCHYSRCHRA